MSDLLKNLANLSPKRLAILALELQQKVEALERSRTEPIAIIGMGCRFPGGVTTPEEYWRLVRDGRDAVSEIPPDRWDVDRFYDPDPDAVGKMYARWGGFVDHVDRFDPHFFGISPREAVSMDPQQRLLLEVCWEALEDAGQPPAGLAGGPTGVFIGISSSDYGQRVGAAGDEWLDTYSMTGNALNFAAGRISYVLGLQGPSLSVDTACSSSLVSVHLACQSLRAGESRMALAAGVNLVLNPQGNVVLSRARMLAKDGRCKTFDASADGYVRGEGCGVVVLKRLSDAIAAGDRILSVIRGSAVNQDGPSSGLTVPNGPAQEALLREVLEAARVAPADVDYVEAHGTGTSLGDPIEVRALGAVYGQNRPKDAPLLIASVKTNLGHLESAAGIAGLIKVVLALQHREVPPHLHLKKLNPLISLESIPAAIPTQLAPWPSRGRLRLGAVSSFGASGTNAHVLLEEAPADKPAASPGFERPRHLLALSAKTPESLVALARRAGQTITDRADLALPDLCFSANAGRSHFSHRLALAGETREELAAALAAYSAGRESKTPIWTGSGTARPKIAFLFTGQGAQAAGMGRELYDTQPTFRRVVDECAELLKGKFEHPLLEVLYGSRGDLINETAYTQPALFVVEYALAALWRSWGITPSIVLGHSVGEYVAACVAGVFSLADALALIAARGRLMQSLPKGGGMAAVAAPENQARAAIGARSSRVSLAGINAPGQVVIAGALEDLEAITAELTARGVRTVSLPVSHAFHSPLLEPMLEAFEQVAASISYQRPQLPVVSNVTGAVAQGDELMTPKYWRAHAREAVQFTKGMSALAAHGARVFVEVGPQPTLIGLGRQTVDAADALWAPSLRSGRGAWIQLLESLGTLYAAGVAVDWAGFDRDYRRRKVALPVYPFQRQRYWVDSRDPSDPSEAHESAPSAAALLGRPLSTALADRVFEARFDRTTLPFLAEHRLLDRVVCPGTAFASMAFAAAGKIWPDASPSVEDVVITQPLVVTDAGRIVQTIVSVSESGDEAAVRVLSRAVDADGDSESLWLSHATATIRASAPESARPESLDAVRRRVVTEVAVEPLYDDLRAAGLDLGPAFQGIERLWRNDAVEALAQIQVTALAGGDAVAVHPATLDSCFQALGGTLRDAAPQGEAASYVPLGITRIRLDRSPSGRMWSHVRLLPTVGSRALTADLTLYDDDGSFIGSIDGLQLARAERSAPADAPLSAGDDLYEVAWKTAPQAIDRNAIEPGVWTIFADAHGLGESLQRQLAQAGSSAVMVRRGSAYRRVADAVEIDPLNPNDIERLLDELSAASTQPLRGIVHLWNLDGPVGAEVDPTASQVDGCASVLHLAQALVRRDVMNCPLWVVTRGAQPAAAANGAVAQAPVWGLCRGVAAEHPELPCVSVDLDPAGKPDDTAGLWREMQVRGRDNQIALRAETRYVPRLTKRSSVPSAAGAAGTAAVRLDITERGMLDNLALKPAARRSPGPREIEIEVSASGLNFRDVLNALGMYPGDPGPIGNECTGTIVAVGSEVVDLKVGERVVALGGGTFGTFVTTPAAFAAPAPPSLDAEDAATIPIAFLTTEYALVNLGRIKKGDRVLIHAAAGGVGLAAVQLALAAGCEIFATASESKRDLLRSLGVQHVMDSRSLAFAEQIREATGGAGVDVVLNSLSGDFVAATVSALGKNARFLELGKIGIWSPEEMRERRPDVDYHIVDFSAVPHEVTTSVLRTVVAKFSDGTLKPLPRKVFPLADAIEAFRYMAQAKHVGKIVLAIGGQRAGSVTCRGDRTYLVTGGYGALGLHVARWMIERGARHVALVGRRGPAASAAQTIEELRRQADVHVVTADVADAGDADRLFNDLATAMPPLAGIVHAAGTLDDGAVLQQRWERFGSVFAPKVAGAWNLDRLTRALPLDFFVLFSSMTSLLGNRGQANYAAANAFLDALAHDRRSRGLPAVTINWGPWADAGMAASIESGKVSAWESLGVGLLTEARGMALLEQAIGSGAAQLAAIPIDWRTFMRSFAAGAEPPLLSEFAVTRGPVRRRASAADRPGTAALQKALSEARPADRARVVQEYVTQQARAVLGLDQTFTFQPHQGLRDVGLDSLMAVELRNRLQRGSGLSLPATLAFDFPTIEALTSRLLEKLGGAEAPAARDAGVRAVAASNADGAPEAIAIVGLGCRFPGGASSPDAFWERLARGFDATAEIPGDRWNIDAYYDPDPDAHGKMYTRRGAFLDRVDLFDPQFFGISPREAVSLDPQQRLLLEVTWEALEHAGKAPDRLFGSKTGVFVGISTNEYGWLQRDAIGTPDVYAGTGNAISAAAGRLSYVLGLQGPSLSVDTACSSSLVAIHLACQSLRARECSLALAGGVNVMLVPDVTVNFCRARMMSADGHCKTFDASADGYVRGEGCGMIVLKRLSDAVAAGDTILAVIAGSGSNQDGRSSGLTVPNGPAQEELLRDVYATAGIVPAEVDYVEAHGTGTSLGDPIEVQALGSVFGRDRRADKPLLLGSVKTNIGHLEAAAGVSGLIKVVLSLQHQQIPPHLHFSVPNPNIPWAELPVEITTSGRAWPADGGRRVAGVSSFGFTGTNAHVVLTSAPAAVAAAAPATERPRHVLALSAKSAEALNELATVYAGAFDASGAPVADICFTASAGRSHFEQRLAVCGESAADFRDGLRAFADGRIPPDARAGRAVGLAPKIAFEFAETIAGGCRELYETQPVFRRALDEYADASRAADIADWLEALLSGTGEIAPSSQAAARVAVAGALSALWRSWGIEPAAVTGDATACAVAAGTLTVAGAMASIASADRRQPTRPSGDRSAVFVASNRQELEAGGFTVVVPIGATQAAWRPLLQRVAELYVAGAPIDWSAFDRAYGRHVVHVPTYPFQRQRYWITLAADSRLFKGAGGITAAASAESLLYEIRWDRQAPPAEHAAAPTSGARGTWLVVADAGGTGAAVAAELRGRGDRCIVLLPQGTRASGADEWVLSSDGADAFEAVIRRAADGGPLKGVLHLSNLDATPVPDTTVTSLALDQTSGCVSVLNLTQALLRSDAGARLWIATSGAQAVETGVRQVSQAPAWGMGRVIALEHPEIWGGLIDVDRSASDRAPAHIVESLAGAAAEDQVVYRNGARYVPRLVSSSAGAGRRLDASGGTYLITGGLGSLGLKTAEWLAERGANGIVLLGRQPLPPREQWAGFGADHPARARIDMIRRIEHHGARVQTFAADVCDAVRMRAVFDDLRRMDPPLKGIVHAAGVSNPRPLVALDAAALEDELSAKTRGSWILHELSRDLPIDFFVCYSSIAAVWGSTGLAHYAAANHFLDALAHHRRAIGLPALSINWGRLWLGGMVSADSAQWLEATGVGALSEEDAAAAFERLALSDLPQATVARMDWTTFKPLYEARGPRPFLSLVGVETAGPAPHAPGRLGDELRLAASPSRAAILIPAMAGWIAGILGLPPDAVSGDVSLSKLGFDSLMALELRNRIQTEVGVTVPLVTIVEGPAVSELATMVVDRFGEAGEGQQAAPPPARQQDDASVDELSDESVDELLRQLLSDKAQ